jgi:hypothetical protein
VGRLQLAARAGERNWGLAGKWPASSRQVARLLDKPLQLIRLLGAALPRFLRRYLERDREKLFLISFNVRVEEREQMLPRHSRLLSLLRAVR